MSGIQYRRNKIGGILSEKLSDLQFWTVVGIVDHEFAIKILVGRLHNQSRKFLRKKNLQDRYLLPTSSSQIRIAFSRTFWLPAGFQSLLYDSSDYVIALVGCDLGRSGYNVNAKLSPDASRQVVSPRLLT